MDVKVDLWSSGKPAVSMALPIHVYSHLYSHLNVMEKNGCAVCTMCVKGGSE